ncbi:MAG: LysR family transcriptional regulator [Solirubrobacterales bacterium]|nr:LysR family transcriptional regulator [Solirubrobacterales bacterium]
MSVDLRHFRSFVVVAQEGHIGRAAQRLFITQPALSRQMQQLEREIDAPILVRTARGVDLTEAGRALLVKARVALEAADDALAVGRLEEPRGMLALGLPLAGGRERWFGLVQAYMQRYPAVEVQAREAMSEQLLDQLVAGELDGALAFAPSRIPSLTYTHVHDEQLSVWLHGDHTLARRSQLELADLGGVRVTLVGGHGAERSGYNTAVRALFADAGVEPEFVATDELFPVRAGHERDYLGISGRHDFPPEVIRVPLVPPRTLPFEFIQRAGVNRAAVRAFAPFAAAHLAGSCAERIAAR